MSDKLSERARVYSYTNRTYCDTLEEMRQCFKTLNFGAIQGLIEECQTYGNRMEAALSDQKDYRAMNDALSLLKKEYKPLLKEIEELEEKRDALKKQIAQLEGKEDDLETE